MMNIMGDILLQVSSAATPQQVSALNAKAKALGALRMTKKFPRERNAELSRMYVVVLGAESDTGALNDALQSDPIVKYTEASGIKRKLIKPIRSSTGKAALRT